MSLKINLRHLEEDGIQLKGELPLAELDLLRVVLDLPV